MKHASTQHSNALQPTLPNATTIAVDLNFRRHRQAMKTTQAELAREAEVGLASISRLENGRANPTLPTLARLCKCLGIKLSQLFEGILQLDRPVTEEDDERQSSVDKGE